jgi:flagellar biosynthesis/type III secretory pathway chaperone
LTTKKGYSRYFIILQEEEKGYSLASDKLPSGYAKFEIKNDKCRVTYYVQNLKKETGPYHMILICNKKNIKKVIKLGELNIDDHGRTEVAYEYNNEDIVGSGIGVEKVVGAAIVKFADTNIIPVMVGFITTETQEDWKQYTLFDQGENELVEEPVLEKNEQVTNEIIENPTLESGQNDVQEEVGLPVEEVNPEVINPIIKDEEPITATLKEEERKASDEIVEEKSIFDSYEENIENIKQDTEGIKEDVENIENIKQDTESIRANLEREIEEANRKNDFPKGAIGDYFKMVAKGLEEEKCVCEEIKRCKWYKVHINDKKDLCDISDYNKYSVIYYPMYSYFKYINKYKHILLGYKYDNIGRMKYIVYAIPGKRSIVEQPFGGKSGFVTWVPLKLGEEMEESLGYWLMFYDFRNRTIAIPIKV